MTPLEFQPLLKRIRWGGTRLGSVLGKPVGSHSDYAESWEIADHGLDQSVVAAGPFKGWTLRQLVAEKNAPLLGRHAGLEQFPLLVKFLDAADRLSVQVHPNDEQAKCFDPAEKGKTEAWVIVAAEPNSRVYAGLKPGVDRKRLQTALSEKRVQECLHQFPVRPGDCVFIPAGTVHAIGEGILLAEIQQMSDLTFRLYDWGRLDADGKPRPLHVNQALDCIDWARGPVGPAAPSVLSAKPHGLEELIRCENFVIRRHTAVEPFVFSPEQRFHILMALSGSARLECDGVRYNLDMGRTVLVPASSPEVRVVPCNKTVLLETFLP